MRILHIYKDYFPVEGGIENHVRVLAEAQAARGHAVSVLVTSRDNHTHITTRNGVRIIYAARLATLASTPVSLAMLVLLSREHPDIAHLQFPYPWGEMANWLVGRAYRTIITYQSDIVRQKYLRVLYMPLMYAMLRRADAILATSPNYIQSSPILARYPTKCRVVPMGIDPAPFEHLTPTAIREARVQMLAGAPLETPLLLAVGVLRYYKGLNYLLEALPQVPEARLAIIGSGPMEHEWRALAQAQGIAARVNFLGEIPNPRLPPYYAACDIFVFPSSERSEAFGLVQVEAMLAGKPIVTTELGTGTSFVTLDGLNGSVVPPRQPTLLAAALRQLLADPALRSRLGAAGRVRAQTEFSLETMINRVDQIYQEVIAT